jgi:hypothetical protein
MKLFITNKDEFEDTFNSETNYRLKTTSEIHKELFNIVQQNFNVENKIDIYTTFSYKKYDAEGEIIFEFIGKNKEMFFFQFNGTIY